MLTPRVSMMRIRRGRRGLGQDDGSIPMDPTTLPAWDPTSVGVPFPSPPDSTVTVPFPQGSPVSLPTISTPSASGSVPTWLQQIFQGTAATTSQIALQQTNPLYHLPAGTYYQTGPGGTVVSTAGVPANAGLPSLTSGGIGGLLPILLIGGLVVMMMAEGGHRR